MAGNAPSPMIQRVYVLGSLPGLNDIIAAAKRGRKGYQPYATMKQECEMVIRAAIRKAKLTPVQGPVMLRFCWHEANKKRDLDNVAAGKKFINDALVHAGILAGDGWAHVHGFTDEFVIDRAYPGVEIRLETL